MTASWSSLDSPSTNRSPQLLDLSSLAIETPSWGYGDSGTRFATFQQPGRPRNVYERIDDAAEVQRLTGTAPRVALHFPWDAVDDLGALRGHIEACGLHVGAVNPNLFQDPDYKLGSITHPDERVRRKAVEHLRDCVEIATALGSTAQSLWFADGTNYPGQDDLRARRRRLLESLREVYAALPAEQELLVEYKLFEPAFYAADLADWGSSLVVCQQLGERARVLVDLGHHAQGTNIEQIVALLAEEGRLGGFHFNNRKYADDDLIVGSVNPFELFLIFCELAAGEELPRLTIDQAHNIEPKVEAMVLSVMNLQEAYAKALLVDRDALADAQQAGDVLAGHRILLDAFQTDVRPLCAEARGAMGAAEDPIAELRGSAYAERRAAERGESEGVAGGWGR
jgi:L-rhamnose isomerase/sugar isomerase